MWEKIMEFVSFTSVITNACIIAFSSLWIKQNLFTKYLHANSEGELLAARLGFILVFEHVVFLFKIILRASIPSVPLTIKLAVQRSKHLNRIANESQDDDEGLDEDLDMYSTSEEDDDEEYEEYEGATDEGERGDGFLGPELGHEQSDIPHRGVSLQDEGMVPYSGRPTQKRSNSWAPFGIFRRGSREQEKKPSQKDPGKQQAMPQQVGHLPTIKENPLSSSSSRPDAVYSAGGYPSLTPTALNTGQQDKAFNHQPRLARHIPYRANTEMDGDWVVLEEPRI